ncbi:hypothetical protein G7Y89_g2653 [Cudoniella acicularis]|uniref:Uncharacterized protein n=1 Tax=Cudoniella acicularis TaxID=354080 RepID=A0A8H4W6R8_9HELO|nr:hypothetical protein G7Y89_g2653 [Cudoniella acicularis]
MDSSQEDKEWASKYLLGPLTAPEPSQKTGPGSRFRRASSMNKGPTVSSSSRDSKTPAINTYPTPPTSASPTKTSFHPSNPYASSSSSSHRQSAFGEYAPSGRNLKTHDEPIGHGKGRRRGSSLGERYPGDMSHRPLDQLRKEAKAAHRAPHLKKQHLPGADIIDSLDKSAFGSVYHHEGPYDATLLARNISYKSSPVAALKESNAEALKATPRENIRDALDKHVPLQGTAVIPPGMSELNGRPMQYEEGADLMRESDAPGGAYKRWEGVKYLPDDYKGKGEPSFSIEKALKEHKLNSRRRVMSDGEGYEMQPQNFRPSISRQRSASGTNADLVGVGKPSRNNMRYSDFEADVRRSNSTGGRLGEGLKRRFGSLRRSKKTVDV